MPDEVQIDRGAANVAGRIDQVTQNFNYAPPRDVPKQLPKDNFAVVKIGRNDAFVGRVSELTRLHKELTTDDIAITAAVSGEGGIGKTELAKAYLFSKESAAHWTGRWWIRASEDKIEQSTAQLARVLGCGLPADTPYDVAREEVLQALNQGKHIIVLDNVEEINRIREFKSGSARILVTTRTRTIPASVAREIRIDVLSPTDARKLLLIERPDLDCPEHEEDLNSVVEHLGRHALALAVAAALLKGPPRISPRELFRRLEETEVGELSDPFEEIDPDEIGTGYRHTVAESLSLHLTDEFVSSRAMLLLVSAAFCHPDAIPIDLLAESVGLDVDESLPELRKLFDKSIVDWLDSILMHRLMQSVVRGMLPQKARHDAIVRLATVLKRKLQGAQNYEHWNTIEPYVSHAYSVVLHAESHGLVGDLSTNLASLLGIYLTQVGRFDLARRSHEIAVGVAPPNSANQAVAHGNLAVVLMHMGEYAKGRHHIELAIAMLLKHYDADHVRLALSYSVLATVQHIQGDMVSASNTIRKVLSIQLKHLPDGDPQLVLTYSNLASFQRDQGLLTDAASNIEHAIEIQRNCSREDDPELARLYSVLSVIQSDIGDLDAATTSIQKAIEVGHVSLPDGHPIFAKFYSNYAMLLASKGNVDEAFERISRAVEISTQALGKYHPDNAVLFWNLGLIQVQKGEHDAGFRSMATAKEIQSRESI